MTMQEHHLAVSRMARYFTLGGGEPREVWFACHGYGQLASRFLEKLRVLDDGHRLLVAPEGLSRFYLSESPTERRVGASWMTREDRLAEIEDYLQYLDAVYADIFGLLDRTRVTVHALGFSQGASTVSRWAAMGKARVDRLILWGGELPPDLDLARRRSCTGARTITSPRKSSRRSAPGCASTAFPSMRSPSMGDTK